MLILSWLMDAKRMGYYTWQEWLAGMRKIGYHCEKLAYALLLKHLHTQCKQPRHAQGQIAQTRASVGKQCDSQGGVSVQLRLHARREREVGRCADSTGDAATRTRVQVGTRRALCALCHAPPTEATMH